MRTASLVAVLMLAGCGGTAAGERTSKERTFEPSRILVRPDGRVLLVGIARLRGKGSECGNQRKETAEFVSAELEQSGEVGAVWTLPQEEVEWCAERVDEAVLLPGGGIALGGPVNGPASEGSADRSFVAGRFDRTGELTKVMHVTYPTTQIAGWLLNREPPLRRESPELRGLARIGGGRLVIGKYSTGYPNYTLLTVGRQGRPLGRVPVRTKSETVVLGVEANRHGIYVLTEEFPTGEGTDYRYGLYRHQLRGALADRARADPARSPHEVATDFALQDNGGTLVAGALDRGETRMLYVMRLTRSGGLDRTWGDDGSTLFPLGRLRPDDNLYTDSRAAVGILSGGRVLVVGSLRGRPAKVFRLDTKGQLDTAFGKGGSVTLEPL